jgi:serine/threonine protein kinase
MSTKAPQRGEPVDVLEGTVINGKFRVLSVLATGGMGRVYRAEQAPLGRVVAIKVLRTPSSMSDTIASEFRRRFFREASILSKLQHTNIVTLFDYGRIEGLPDERYFMAMELVGGVTLSERLKKTGALSVQETLRVMRQMARGLREAHKLGAVHRDLKPSNVMLVPEEDGGEVVKILDFGIGKLLGDDGDQELTQEGAFLGSPKYIAPEQVNERRVDARTDVYALGVIGYECLTGKVPFEGETNLETILAHTSRPVPPMANRAPDVSVPAVAETFVRRCLEKEPAARPQGMEEVLRAITECERALFGAASLGAMNADGPVSTARIVQRAADRRSDIGTLALQPSAHPPRPSGGTSSPLTNSMAPTPARSTVPLVVFALVVVLTSVMLLVARWTGYIGQPKAAAAGSAVTPAVAPPPPPAASATAVEVTPAASTTDVVTPPETTISAAPSASAPPAVTHAPRWTPPRVPPSQRPLPDTDIKLQR